MSLTLKSILKASFQNFANRKALGFVGEPLKTYEQLQSDILAVCVLMEDLNIVKGDKVAILGGNSPQWAAAFFALNMKGIVAVPLLPDFHNNELENILEHSESKAIFVSGAMYHKISNFKGDGLAFRILLDTFKVLPQEVTKDDLAAITTSLDYKRLPSDIEVAENDLASIIYTSGTTGTSKGVMLSNKNIIFDAINVGSIFLVLPEDKMLSILPLSHTYENTLGLVLPIMMGASVYYLRTPPTPTVLMSAFKEVKPTVVLSVPLIIEKIYKGKVLPQIESKFITRHLYRFAPTRKVLNKVAGKKLMTSLGGELRFFGLGGAKVSAFAEKFLIEAKFPYAIGYGLTETSPLIAGSNPDNSVFQSTGQIMEGIHVKLNMPDPATGEGEIWIKGDNVMQGYYKQPELTKEVMSEDGYFKTGDLGCFDKKGNLYIKGRLKSIIVGSSGENIYPEEIENVINNYPYVIESLVVENKGKLVAMVHLNLQELEEKYHHLKEKQLVLEEKIEETLREIKHHVNSTVNKFSQVQLVVLQAAPFERTATQKLKRFLYSYH